MSDFDDLDALKRALEADTPVPAADPKAAALARAQENFDRHQGNAQPARQTSVRPETGILRGVKAMLAQVSNRGVLTASTALVAVGLFAVVPALRDSAPGDSFQPVPAVVAPAAEPEAGQRADDTSQFATDLVESGDLESPIVLEDIAPQAERAQRAPAVGNQVVAPSTQPVAPAAKMIARDRGEGLVAVPSPDVAVIAPEVDTEAYPDVAPGDLKVVAEEPVSTFSIDVDTASYAVVRDSLLAGQMPPARAVRVEEMVNYFRYDYAAPGGDAAFSSTVSVAPTPWNAGTQLVQIGIQGAMPAVEDRPPLNLVFLIDTSGSMNQPDKLPLLVQSFRLMLGQLRPEDEVSIVTYAGSAGQVLEPTSAAETRKILTALERLQAGGSTAGQAGLQQAYDVATSMAKEGEVNRVILATDGDFNVGLSDPEALKDFIAQKRDSGTYLSVLGFGRGNLDDATMQALAQNGNGQAAYVDTLSEAQKVLVDQLTGALFPIANDVKIQVEFNPSVIAEYRLIGYETRALRREDFNNDRVDAGDIGAGHQVTALYEVTPVGSKAVRNTPLRYAQEKASEPQSDELGFLRLRYKAPGAQSSRLIEAPITDADAAEPGFAVAIAGFAELLRGSDYLQDWGWDEAIALAQNQQGDDPFGYRREALSLMRLAQSLSSR